LRVIRKRNLLVTNLLAGLILVAALAVGWREAALFGLAVLAVMDLIVLVRGRLGRRKRDRDDDDTQTSP
jgi:hypothetical protein